MVDTATVRALARQLEPCHSFIYFSADAGLAFAGLGLEAVQVWLSDRAAPMIPPYASAAERAAREVVDGWRSDGTGPFDRDEARANVLAGGGSPDFFDAAWEAHLAHDRESARAQAEGRWHAAGGALLPYPAGHTQYGVVPLAGARLPAELVAVQVN